MRLGKHKQLIALLLLAATLAVLVPQHQARADLLSIGSVTTDAVTGIVNYINNIIMGFVNSAIKFFALQMDRFITYQTNSGVYGIFVVDNSWKQIRDFVNMFFILIMIVMAFGTIFDIKGYDWSSLIARFIISALLVNFSLAIGQYIITIANGIAGVFLKQITSAGGISNTFAQGFSIVKTAAGDTTKTSLVDAGGSVAVTTIFALIFLVVVMFAFAVAFIFSIIRLFALWALLIVSPIAWLGYTIPNIRKKTWSMWWSYFLCWCFWLPYYLFFVMFAVIFVANKSKFPVVPGGELTAGLTGNDIMFYGLSLGFLMGGLSAAKSWACKTGGLATNLVGGIEGNIKRVTGYSALQKGVKQTKERIKEEGLPGRASKLYGGERAERQKAAKFGSWLQQKLGYTPKFEAQKEFTTEGNKEYDNLKQQFDLGQIQVGDVRRMATSNAADTRRGFAYRKLLAELGQLDEPLVAETLRVLADNPYASVEFLKTASKAKFSAVPAATLLAMANAEGPYRDFLTNVAARKELFKYIQKEDRILGTMAQPQFDNAVVLFGGRTTAAGGEFIKDVQKIRPDLVADYNVRVPPPGVAIPPDQFILGGLRDVKDIASIPSVVWTNINFRRAMWDKLRQGTVRNQNRFRDRLEQSILFNNNAADAATKWAVVTALLTGVRP